MMAVKDVEIHVETSFLPAAPTYLSVHGGVPVRVVEDDRVGACEVHAHSAAAGRQDEDEQLRVRVEALHQHLPHETRF